MELRSQNVRTLAPENDPLKMGMGWKVEDLAKPQIMVESIRAVPGSIRPSASAMICMVEAVPIKEQAPQLGQALCL